MRPRQAAHALGRGFYGGLHGEALGAVGATMSDLFDRVVQASGLSPLFARNALQRACQRAGVEPKTLSAAALRTALPEIERTLQTFLDTGARAVMDRIEDLSRGR